MKIAYGLAGDGLGHATRSGVVIDYLRRAGNSVRVLTSGRAHAFLRGRLPDVTEIASFRHVYTDGTADYGASLAASATAAGSLLTRATEVAAALDAWRPDLVVTDLEPVAGVYAHARGLPCLAIDNHQLFTHCDHDPAVWDATTAGHRAVAFFTGLCAAVCDHAVITSFYHPPVKASVRAVTTLVPPILRPEILAATPTEGPEVLVYQTGDYPLAPVLATAPRQLFVVYGAGRTGTAGNCTFRAPSHATFVADLAACRGVVATAGMSLMGEAVALGKPVLALPMRHQPEQEMNAVYLERLGYGMAAARLTPDALASFLGTLPSFRRRFREAPRHDANLLLYDTLDRALGATRAGIRPW